MFNTLQILPVALLDQYRQEFKYSLREKFGQLHDSELSIDTFSFYTSIAAVFSSKIEGEDIELDSFVKHKRFGIAYQPDYTRKIDDLYEAYVFAQTQRLSCVALCDAHAQLSKNILHSPGQGSYRTGNMYVTTDSGRIEYVAVEPSKVATEMQKLCADIETLLNTNLEFEEVFFFAAMLHLVFVKIHPSEDGNGRAARLLEKWFLAEKLGPKAWFINSERNYYSNHQLYYSNIRQLGVKYEALDYGKAMGFLRMLAETLGSL